MEKGVVSEIAGLAKAGQEIGHLFAKVGEHVMSTTPLHHIAPKLEPEPDALGFATLGALVEYVRANKDGLELEKCVLHVASPTEVRLRGPLTGERRQRFTYASASAIDLTGDFLNKYHGQDTFIVSMQTRFTGGHNRGEVLGLIGRLKDEQSIESEDDGVTQHVTAKQGVHIARQVQVPNPVTLAPFRTFREVEQPASPFLLRVRKGDNGPGIGLFEADGGAWRLAAVQAVAEWLRGADLKLPILS